MTIESIIRNRKGTAHAWRVERDIDNDPYVGDYYTLFHYSTAMLRWRHSLRYGDEIIDYDLRFLDFTVTVTVTNTDSDSDTLITLRRACQYL